MKVDMHTHCCWSRDSRTPIAAQAAAAVKAGLDVVCATDHDTIEGALLLREAAAGRFQVVIGEEISTADGDLIGLFLERAVPRGLSAEESIADIHSQGGLACVPHPFSRNRRHHMREAALERVAPLLDLVEVFNAREMFPSDNERAARWAAARGIPGAVGSDAHRPFEIGNAWLEMAPFADAAGFLASVRTGTPHGRLAGVGVHVFTRWDSLLNRVVGPVR
ncbi:MAG: PHP domain-containing protein [Chloroflexi bacterium]|nr:PHP domain-containing protein [Chloroflexota bacterium]